MPKKTNPATAPVKVRVYLWSGTFINLTMACGSHFSFSKGGYTGEGWTRTDIEVWREGTFIYMRQTTNGSDCDGRHSSVWCGRCHISGLRSKLPFRRVARWETVGSYCRDFTAEAAGY